MKTAADKTILEKIGGVERRKFQLQNGYYVARNMLYNDYGFNGLLGEVEFSQAVAEFSSQVNKWQRMIQEKGLTKLRFEETGSAAQLIEVHGNTISSKGEIFNVEEVLLAKAFDLCNGVQMNTPKCMTFSSSRKVHEAAEIMKSFR